MAAPCPLERWTGTGAQHPSVGFVTRIGAAAASPARADQPRASAWRRAALARLHHRGTRLKLDYLVQEGAGKH